MALYLGGGEDEFEPFYSFHFFDIKNKPIRCLKLWQCEIVVPHLSDIQFDSLRVLDLSYPWVDDDSLADLIARCKNYEKLLLSDFDGSRNFKIRSKSLKVLKLSNYYCDVSDKSSIEIYTPNLSKIKVTNFHAFNYVGDLSSVKLAQLCFWNGGIDLQNTWGNVLSWLHGVESLKIPGKRFPDQADSREKFFDEFSNMEFKLHIPSLMEVKMTRIRNTMFEYWILLLLWKHGVVLNKVVLVPAVLGEPIAVLDPTSNDFIKFLAERSTMNSS